MTESEPSLSRPSVQTPLLIWGAGAMGGTIGAALARAGHAVRLVDQDREHVEAMRSRGLAIVGPVAEFSVPADAWTPTDLSGTYDRVLLCVKAHHTADAIAQVEPFLAKDGYVVSIQNGLNEVVIADHVGATRTIGAFVNFGADLLEPGVVHWGGRGAVVLGELNGSFSERLRQLHTVLLDFEPGAIQTDNVLGYLWSKLAYGALLFATALTDASIADVLDSPAHRSLLVEVGREVCRVADSVGIRLEAFDGFDPSAFGSGASDGDAHRSLADLVAFNRRSAKTHSGIWRDLAVRKRRTEVDAQLGPIVDSGERTGVAVPLIARIIHQIHEIEQGTRAQRWANLDELTRT
ncbi:MAG: 2-dehydropantoate 2-reductase [Gemmatimonadota bacterium]